MTDSKILPWGERVMPTMVLGVWGVLGMGRSVEKEAEVPGWAGVLGTVAVGVVWVV